MIKASEHAKRTHNPIRAIVDNLKLPENHPKKLLNLALGDPTVHGNVPVSDVLIEAVQESLISGKNNGYLNASGGAAAKEAVAGYFTRPDAPVTPQDVVLTSACSGALEHSITVLLNPGDNILVPNPGFPLYQVITESFGGHVKKYNLLPSSNWEVDIAHAESLIDANTKAILVNNPSNPCGSNYSREHLLNIVTLARRHNLPIIADEIYGGLVYEGEFTPLGSICGDVPVLSVGGIAKQFAVPGWRIGWIIVHDYSAEKKLSEVRTGLQQLAQLILGACSLLQAALPRILTPTAADAPRLEAYNNRYKEILSSNATLCAELTANCPEITVVQPQGAMYCMVRINVELLDGIEDDVDFSKKLLVEENVSMLPGQCFGMKNFIRLVICPPADTVRDAFERIVSFCGRYKKK